MKGKYSVRKPETPTIWPFTINKHEKQRVKTVENSSDTLYHIKISRLYLKIFHGKRAKYESLLQHQGTSAQSR